jgi:hypothetical protein
VPVRGRREDSSGQQTEKKNLHEPEVNHAAPDMQAGVVPKAGEILKKIRSASYP